MPNSILVDPTQVLKTKEKSNDGTVDAIDKELEEVQVPEKYKGKSVQDLIAMHQDAETKASRIGNEVGQLRRRNDDLERQVRTREEKQKENVKPVTVDDVLENPQEAIERVIQSKKEKSSTKDLEDSLNQQAKQDFYEKYPEFKKDLEKPEFFEWINKSKLRKTLAQAADSLDYVAANELWDQWEERQELLRERQEEKEQAKKEKKEAALKKGTLESGNGTPLDSKKTFSRSQVRDLLTRAAQGDIEAKRVVESPKWQEDRRKAYAEGRITD